MPALSALAPERARPLVTRPSVEPIQVAPARKRLDALDALRGFAVLLIFLPHATGLFGHLDEASWSRRFTFTLGLIGTHGVDIFFVLSGLVVALTSANLRWTFATVPRFMARRCARLTPPYWASIVAMLAVGVVQSLFSHKPIAFPSAGRIAANLFYVQEFTGAHSLNVVYWTLSLEVQFYLFFALAAAGVTLLARSLRRNAWQLAIAALVFSFAISFGLFCKYAAYFGPDSKLFIYRWYEFALGIFAWALLSQRGKPYTSLVLVTVTPASLIALVRGDWTTLTATASFYLILFLGHKELLGTRVLGALPQAIGEISYSFYLFHVPLIFLFLGARERVAPTSPVASWGFFAVTLLAALAVARLAYLFIERPAMQWSRSLKVEPTRE